MGNSESDEIDEISVTVKTEHKHPIDFAIHYQYTSGTWYTMGWWSVTNTSTCRPNIHTKNRYIYFHAHCNTCDAEWGDKNHQFLCHKHDAFDSTSNPSDIKNYEYKKFNEKNVGEYVKDYTFTFI